MPLRRGRPSALALIAGVIVALGGAAVTQAQFGLRGRKTDLVQMYDRDGDGWLNAAERMAARLDLNGGTLPRRPAAAAAPRTAPRNDEVRIYHDEPLYATNVVRTLFLTFAESDWEQEMIDFYRTDIDVPAEVRVDGRVYHDVGVHFRGQT